ncbi:MAG: NADPH-dependent curcumin reductase CurA [Cryomorphaceae bacterium]|jgi:NADPH-dependent curcumin reductase CurA
MTYTNRAVVLAARPQGEPKQSDFRIEESKMPALEQGQVLIKTLWLSLDPYMRPMMNDAKSYANPVPLGGVIVGESVGEVIESRSEKFSVGDHVTSYSGWQAYSVANDTNPMIYKIRPAGVPLQAYLGAAGMTGRTAYFGLLNVGKPQAGETVVVSAASGAVGGIVGQIAKMQGCHVVGVAGGETKCNYVVEQLQSDACVDYKAGALPEHLSEACPDGIDVYFENVGGDVARAVAPLLNEGARVPICGFVSSYNDVDISKAQTPQKIFSSVQPVPEHRFFLQNEWQDQHQEVTDQLTSWINEGRLIYEESIVEGLENAVTAFQGMLKGKNFGKQLVKVS